MSLVARYRSSWSGLPRELWQLALVVLVHRAGSMVLPFLALWLTTRRGFDVTEAGGVVALYGLGALLGSLAGGRLSDRFGPFAMLATSLVLGGLLLVVLGWIEDPLALRALVFAHATAIELGRPAGSSAVVLLSPPEQRTRAFALWRTAVNLGVTIGPALGGVLASFDYRLLFVVDGLTSLVAAVVLARTLGLRRPSPRASTSDAPERSPWRDGLFLVVLAALLVHATVFFQLVSTFGLYLATQRGFDELELGLAFALNSLCVGLLEMPLVHRLSRRASLPIAAVGALCVGLGLGALPLAHSRLAVLATVLVWTTGEMLVEPFAASFVSSRAGERSRGRFLGLHTSVYATAFVAAPIAGTAVWERWGPDAVWHAALAGGLLAAGVLALLARRERRRAGA